MQAILSPFRVLIIFLATAVVGTASVVMRLFGVSSSRVIYLSLNRWWGPFVLWVSGVKVTCTGLENINPDKPAIYVANHASFLDIPVIGTQTPLSLYFVAKKSLARVPFLGWYVRAVEMIFIDRSNREKAMQSMEDAAEIIQSGRNVLSFPEGTRTKTGEVGMFKRGSFVIALSRGIDVVPITLTGTGKCLAPNSFRINPGNVTMHIHPRMITSDLNFKSSEAFAKAAEDIVKGV